MINIAEGVEGIYLHPETGLKQNNQINTLRL